MRGAMVNCTGYYMFALFKIFPYFKQILIYLLSERGSYLELLRHLHPDAECEVSN